MRLRSCLATIAIATLCSAPAMAQSIDLVEAVKDFVVDVEAASGRSGPNDAYVFNTLTHLRDMGIRDHWLEQVAGEVERMRNAS